MTFKKGQSGNPGGRRPKGFTEFQDLCRTYSFEAQQAMLAAIKDKDCPFHMKAVELCFNYAWGKPKQQVDLSGEVGGKFEIVIKSYKEVEADAKDASA